MVPNVLSTKRSLTAPLYARKGCPPLIPRRFLRHNCSYLILVLLMGGRCLLPTPTASTTVTLNYYRHERSHTTTRAIGHMIYNYYGEQLLRYDCNYTPRPYDLHILTFEIVNVTSCSIWGRRRNRKEGASPPSCLRALSTRAGVFFCIMILVLFIFSCPCCSSK